MQHLRFTGHIRTTDKDSLNLLAEKFLVNIDDQLDLIRDLRYLKSMFTLDKVNNRKAFDKYNPNRPRIASFVASVNSSEFLTDDQNRRYLVFNALEVDFKAMNDVDKSQLWAQVKQLLQDGFKYWFDVEENAKISEMNDAFRVKPEEEEMLMEYFEPDENGEPMLQTQILHYLQLRTPSKLNSRTLSTSLKKRGFSRKGVRDGSKVRYMYLVKKLTDEERQAKNRSLKIELIGDQAIERFEKKMEEEEKGDAPF